MMKTMGFKCNACGTGFEEVVPEDPNAPAIKCPGCGSDDVTESETVLEFLELIQEMGRTGG